MDLIIPLGVGAAYFAGMLWARIRAEQAFRQRCEDAMRESMDMQIHQFHVDSRKWQAIIPPDLDRRP